MNDIAYGLVLVVHIGVALFLIAVILVQGGRGGLGETLGGAAAQSLFGGAANTVMSKVTAVGATLFMVTCLSLALLSTARGRSVIDRLPAAAGALPFAAPAEAPSSEGAASPAPGRAPGDPLEPSAPAAPVSDAATEAAPAPAAP